MNKIAILGAGAFGFAMATVIAHNNNDKEIYLFDVQKEHIDHIKQTRQHKVFHQGGHPAGDRKKGWDPLGLRTRLYLSSLLPLNILIL